MNRPPANPDDSERSNPRRDRALAAQTRHGYRNALDLTKLSDQFMHSAAMRDAKRHQRMIGVMRRTLGEEISAAVHPQQVRSGRLLLLVDDSVLLAEIRNHYHHQLLENLVATGCGVTDIVYRISRS